MTKIRKFNVMASLSSNDFDKEITEEDIRIVSEIAGKPMTENDFVKVVYNACNDVTDRQLDTFTPNSLEVIKNTSVGKPLLIDHDSRKVLGKIYGSQIVKDNVQYIDEKGNLQVQNGADAVQIKAYIPKLAGTQNTLDEIESGIRNFCSVGVSVTDKTCSICDNSYFDYEKCHHIKGHKYRDTTCTTDLSVSECFEISSVYLGAQYGAQMVKELQAQNLSFKSFEVKEGEIMDEQKEKYLALEKNFKELEVTKSDLEKSLTDSLSEKDAVILEKENALKSLNEKVEQLEGIVKELGENVTVDEVKTLKSNADVGQLARVDLIEDIKKDARVVEKEVFKEELMDNMFKFMSFVELKEYKEYYSERKKSMFAPEEAVKAVRSTEPANETEVPVTKSNGARKGIYQG